MQENNNLVTEKISKLFLNIVIPSMIAMVILGIQGMIDGLFLGNFVGSNAMASVNIAIPFMQGASAIGLLVSTGSSAFIGRTLGAKDDKKSKDIFKTSFIFLIISGLIFFLISQVYNQDIAKFLGANDILLEESSTYIKIIGISLPFLFIYFFTSFVNRLIDKPQLFVIGTVLGIIVNIAFNYMFIVKLNMGVTGAGFATGISYFIGFLVNIVPFTSNKTIVNIYKGSFDKDILLRVLYNGSSEGVTSISTAITTWVFNLTFMHYYGENGVAAFTIVNYIASIANSIIFGIVDGVSPIISYNYGANLIPRVKKATTIAILINLIVGISTYLVVFLFGEKLIGMFAKGDTELIFITYEGAKLYATMFFLCGINIFASSYFTSIGEALNSIIISSSRGLIFILIGIILLPQLFGVMGVWLVPPFAELISMLILIIIIKNKK